MIAAVASAMFNIFLFRSLDPSFSYILISLSIALEGAKLTTVISINVTKSLFLKLNYKPLLRLTRRLFVLYLVYGLLSIMASLGFSTYITAKTETLQNTALQIMVSQRESIVNKMGEISNLRQSASISSVLEYPPYVDKNEEVQRAREFFEERNRLYLAADDADTVARARLSGAALTDANYSDLQLAATEASAKMQGFRTQMRNAQTQLNQARAELTRIEEIFNMSKGDMAGAISRLEDELRILISQANIEAGTGDIALILIDANIQREHMRVLEEKGMAYMFEGFSNYTGGKIPPDWIKIFILLLASVLLELTIFQCAPSIKINKLILKYFKRSLPEDRPFHEIINMYRDEDGEEIQESEQTTAAPIEQPRPRRQRPQRRVDPVVVETGDDGVTETPLVPVIDATLESSEPEPIPVPANVEVEPRPEAPKSTRRVVEAKDHIADEINDGSTNVKERYRFATTTPFVVTKFVEFIEKCIGPEEGRFVMDPAQAASEMKLNSNTRDIFLSRLTRLTLGGKVLVERMPDGYYANFDVDRIKEYVSERVGK